MAYVYSLQYEQRRNGKHAAWIDVKSFHTLQDAVDAAKLPITKIQGEYVYLGRDKRDRIVQIFNA